jgi:hypothetical protein
VRDGSGTCPRRCDPGEGGADHVAPRRAQAPGRGGNAPPSLALQAQRRRSGGRLGHEHRPERAPRRDPGTFRVGRFDTLTLPLRISRRRAPGATSQVARVRRARRPASLDSDGALALASARAGSGSSDSGGRIAAPAPSVRIATRHRRAVARAGVARAPAPVPAAADGYSISPRSVSSRSASAAGLSHLSPTGRVEPERLPRSAISASPSTAYARTATRRSSFGTSDLPKRSGTPILARASARPPASLTTLS